MIAWLLFIVGLLAFLLSLSTLLATLVVIHRNRARSLAAEEKPEAATIPLPVVFVRHHALVNEMALKDQMVFWDQASVDALYFSHDIPATLRELEEISKLDKGESDKLYHNRPDPHLDPVKAMGELRPFYSEDPPGFKQRPGLWVSTLDDHSASEIIYGLVNYGPNLSPNYFADFLKVCKSSVLDHLDRKTGLMSASRGAKCTMIATRAGWGSLGRLGAMEEALDLLGPRAFQALADYKQVWDSKMAFADYLGGERAICSTNHALLTIAQLPEEARHKIEEQLEIRAEYVMNFLSSCWEEHRDAGGYLSARLRKDERPTLIHTRYALALYRLFIERGVEEASGFLSDSKAIKILRFIDSLVVPQGCEMGPGVGASLYATRAALLVMKYLELFRVRGLFSPEQQYYDLRNKLVTHFSTSMETILEAYRDTERGGYRGFPAESVAR